MHTFEKRGFTLIETLIVSLILVIVFFSSVDTIVYQEKNIAQMKNQASVQNYSWLALPSLIYEVISAQTLNKKKYLSLREPTNILQFLALDPDSNDRAGLTEILESKKKYEYSTYEVKIERMFVKDIPDFIESGDLENIGRSLPLNERKRRAHTIERPFKAIVFTISMEKKGNLSSLNSSSIKTSCTFYVSTQFPEDSTEAIEKCARIKDEHAMDTEFNECDSFVMFFDELGRSIYKEKCSNINES